LANPSKPSPSKIPLKLYVLARRYSKNGEHEELVQDMVLDFLLRRNQAGCASKLASLEAHQVEAVLNCRIRQQASRAHPEHSIRRALRAKIQKALKKLPMPAPAAPPLSLFHAHQLKQIRVNEAVAYAVHHGQPPKVNELCHWMFSQYDFKKHLTPADAADLHPYSHPTSEVVVTVQALRVLLGAELLSLILHVREGATLSDWATKHRCSVGTAHNRLKKAQALLKSYCRKHLLTAEHLKAALDAVAEDATGIAA